MADKIVQGDASGYVYTEFDYNNIIIVDPNKNEVYFTPLYYVMSHFSKFMRPGALKIGCSINNKDLMATAVQNPDKSIAIVIFNPTENLQSIEIKLNNQKSTISINAKALQTVVIKP